MARLIDADELLLRFIPRGGDNNFTRFVRETVRLRLAEMPTVDAEPVRHGQWLTSLTGWLYCSECRGEPPYETNVGTDYCPNCGAKMDKTEERLVMPKADGSTIKISKMDEVEQ